MPWTAAFWIFGVGISLMVAAILVGVSFLIPRDSP
jgi:hypothetical protein